MAKNSNDDILGQIFDFIFTQQELPPDKRKPVDASGIAGDSELINAVAAVLENPAVFGVDHMVEEYEEALNLKLAEVRLSEDNIKPAEIGVASLTKLLTDPVAYFQKIRSTNKAIRKSMRAKYLGAAATEFLVSAYLRKQGFSKELANTITNNNAFRSSYMQMYEFSNYKEAEAYAQSVATPPMLSGADKEYHDTRTVKLQAKLAMDVDDWDNLSEANRNRIVKGLQNAENNNQVRALLRGVLGQQQGGTVYNSYIANQRAYSSYRDLELANLNREANHIHSNNFQNGSWLNDSSRLAYDRTILAKDFLQYAPSFRFIAGRTTPQLLGNYGQFRNNLANQISQIRQGIRRAQSRGDRNEERMLRESLKERRAMMRTIAGINVVGNIGMIEGYYNSIKDYWNLQSLINGDFFKSSKNQLYCPTKKTKFEWNAEGRIIAEYMIPADHKRRGERRYLLDSYNESFTNIYYLTPGSIFRTFFYNGERFAWKAYKQRRDIENFLSNNTIPGFDLNRFTRDSTYRQSVLNGTLGITNQTLLQMLDRYAKLGNLTEMFSVMYRTQSALLDRINTSVFQGFRQRIYNGIIGSRVFSRLTDGSVATDLLKKWVNNGSLRNLFKGLSHAIAEALGISLGPGLNLIISTVMGFVSEKLYDLTVPLLGFVLFGVLGILVSILLLFSSGVSRQNAVRYSIAASTPPGQVGYCDAELINPNPGGDIPFLPPVKVPPPTNSSCPFGDVAYYCTQGYTNTFNCSHERIKNQFPVDLARVTYFYAPQYCNESNCTATTQIDPPRCADGNYTGQWVTFNDGKGNAFILGHTKFIPPSNGRNYRGGEPVAYIYQSAAELIADDPQQKTSGTSFYCWTGSHIHLTIRHNGAYIDPISFLYEMGCVNGPSEESQCAACYGG